jgi:nucleoside-diphosphate-sugar epimerase
MLAHEVRNPSMLWQSNVEGTRNVATTAAAHRVSKVIFTSSNCLWAHNFGRPVTEADEPQPVEIYGRSKWEAERVLAAHQDDFDCAIIRCPTIVAAERLGLLAILFEFIDEGRRIWVVGNGTNRYQFVYGPDLAEAMLLALRSRGHEVYNVGSENVPQLRQVYEYVIKHAGTGARVASLPRRPALLAMRVAHSLGISPLGPYQYRMIAEDFQFDTGKIKARLGWRPTKRNEQMLLEAYEHYRLNRAQIAASRAASAHRHPARMGILRLLKWVS